MEVHPMIPTSKLAALGFVMGLAMHMPATCALAGETAQPIKITATKFRFTPDHITLVTGQPATLQITSTDVTHGFMARALKIDTDIKPGKVTEISVTPETAGSFKVICDHYCGLGHSGMKM